MMRTVAGRAAEAAALLARVAHSYEPAALASGFGAEGMVLIDLVARERLPLDVFTLDTGRLPEETHALIVRVRERYAIEVTVYAPSALDIEAYVREHGPNGFYDSLEAREQCCALRKSAPLARALAGRRAWITGLRRDASVTRHDIEIEDYDAKHGLPKFNPLADWSREDVWSYIRAHDVPYNALHDRGYASIGCAPCTRAIEPGEDERAGRWWWESPERRECGLHARPGTVVSAGMMR
jgi:phosphoadenosine phosphosulfate reductase